ncbi:MAG: 16S rRNA (guanine(966)-N(2))-methyltransferase RsmD [Planctomycetia bacterium]|nr:16S rRNA (guanine(966)-N(2))-methyltransferase RsmD [Planctomycetia bacterium]
MRIIAGDNKRMRLLAVPGSSTRPITDRVKESLFNILGVRVVDATVLDLFCGSGSMGLESLSRGARWVAFLDSSGKAIEVLRRNIERLGVGDRCKVFKRDAFRLDDWAASDEGYGLVFVDPPYALSRGREGSRNMQRLLHRMLSVLAPHALIVIRHEAKGGLELAEDAFVVVDVRRYGRMCLTMLTYSPQSNECCGSKTTLGIGR